MAIFKLEYDFKDDKEHFEELYEVTYEEFIEKYGDDKEIIDLTDKVIVSLRADSDRNLPMDLLTVFIPEEEKHNYKATLIYAGHIAFIKLEYKDGKIVYLYKDDECSPMTFEYFLSIEDDATYCCEQNGFKVSDTELQIEKFIQSVYDFNFILDIDNVIVLEGL